jgi:hypothetical protein
MTVMPKELSEVVKSDKFHFKEILDCQHEAILLQSAILIRKTKLNYQLAVYGEIPFSLSLSFIGMETSFGNSKFI